jgi:hypothetical protein
VACAAGAVWPFGLLAGGIGSEGWAIGKGTRVNGNNATVDADGKSVKATGSGTSRLFADTAVLRTVTWAFEPLGTPAPGNLAPEVYAFLVERNKSGFHALKSCTAVELFCVLHGAGGVGHEVGAGVCDVERLALRLN